MWHTARPKASWAASALLIVMSSRGCDPSEPQNGSAPEYECRTDDECDRGEICSIGDCLPGCRNNEGCDQGWECIGQRCLRIEDAGSPDGGQDLGNVPACSEDMVLVEPGDGRRWCIDIYEASRSDATAGSQGTTNGASRSRAGVMPWSRVSWEHARDACERTEKRFCSLDEWITTCRGPDDTTYPYGNEYRPEICNGIDTHGRDHRGELIFYPEPTGHLDECTNGYGVFDISGNLWEYTAEQNTARPRINGGAYNCIDSALLHECSHAQYHNLDYSQPRFNGGFRCCKDPADR